MPMLNHHHHQGKAIMPKRMLVYMLNAGKQKRVNRSEPPLLLAMAKKIKIKTKSANLPPCIRTPGTPSL